VSAAMIRSEFLSSAGQSMLHSTPIAGTTLSFPLLSTKPPSVSSKRALPSRQALHLPPSNLPVPLAYVTPFPLQVHRPSLAVLHRRQLLHRCRLTRLGCESQAVSGRRHCVAPLVAVQSIAGVAPLP
jgi:hypothetical protein